MKKYWKNDENKAAFEHARDLTAHHSKSFYISTRLLPREKQWATFGLYGFCRYADNLIDNPRERSVGELLREVDYLHEEVSIAYRTGESEHPIIRPFITVAREYAIPEEYPQDLLRGVKMDLEITRYESFDALYTFAYRVAGVVGLMMTHVLGYKDESAFQYAEKLGIAMQLTNILRDVKEDAEKGRIYLPQEELRKFSVSEESIFNGETSENLHILMQYQVDRAHQYYQEAEPGIKMLSTSAQFAIYSASKIYRGILHRIEAQDFNPFLGRVFVPQAQKFGILAGEIVRTKVLNAPKRLIPAGT